MERMVNKNLVSRIQQTYYQFSVQIQKAKIYQGSMVKLETSIREANI